VNSIILTNLLSAVHSTCTNSSLLHAYCYTTTGENSTGALTTRLEEDANIMAQATGLELGHKVHIAMTLIIGIIIGLIVAWQVGLVAMAVVPLIGKCAIMLRNTFCCRVIYCPLLNCRSFESSKFAKVGCTVLFYMCRLCVVRLECLISHRS
jgi:ABC-type multidrug transport system fused ATPase/permease subunit